MPEQQQPVSLRAPAFLVAPRARWMWTVQAALQVALLAAFFVLWWSVDPRADRALQRTVGLLAAALAVAYVVGMPQWRYRVHRWEATPTAVYTQTGWLNQERRIAPVSRIQTVDLVRGPVAQVFGLASVRVTTASAAGPLHIDGLDVDVARRLVESLTAATVAAPGGADPSADLGSGDAT